MFFFRSYTCLYIGSSKDRIHLLEGAVITWTKQIKNVLKQDPESMLKQGLHPTPDVRKISSVATRSYAMDHSNLARDIE